MTPEWTSHDKHAGDAGRQGMYALQRRNTLPNVKNLQQKSDKRYASGVVLL